MKEKCPENQAVMAGFNGLTCFKASNLRAKFEVVPGVRQLGIIMRLDDDLMGACTEKSMLTLKATYKSHVQTWCENVYTLGNVVCA